MFYFETQRLQLLRFGLIDLFSIFRFLNRQRVRFLCGDLAEPLRYVVVFVQVLCRKTNDVSGQRPGGVRVSSQSRRVVGRSLRGLSRCL